MSDPIQDAINAAKAKAAETPAASSVPAAAPASASSVIAFRPGGSAPPLKASEMMVGSFSVDSYAKVTEDGIKIGDSALITEDIKATLDMSEAFFYFGVKYGNPPTYEKTIDKVYSLSGKPWQGILDNAARVDGAKFKGDYRSADVPLTILADVHDITFPNTAHFVIEYKAQSAGSWNSVYADNSGTISITGKTTSTYVKEFRFAVNRISEPYMIRVTKTSPENDTQNFVTMAWESFQEIDSQPVTHNNTAVLQIVGQASDQFSSIPDFWMLGEGFCELKVPTNYDPRTKIYSGIWDGTFKIAWTDNPAWFLYNYVTNTDWGMSHFSPVTMDKFSVYDAAVWCDTMVDDGAGGLQARYTLNTLVTEAQSGAEFARYIAGTFNAAFYDDQNGTAFITVDKDDAALHIFAQENVSDGLFTYTFSDTTDRYNDITVAFNNKDLVGYAEDRRRVFDQSQIDTNGRVPLDFIAVGCVDEHEAIRRATYKLITATTEVTTVTFRTNRQGRYVNVFDVMLIADPDMGWGLSGRILSLNTGRDLVQLRDPVYLEAGVAYTAQFKLPNGIIEKNIVSPSAGYNTQLQLDSALPSNIPDRAVFDICEASGGIGSAKPFRVMKVAPVDGDQEQIEITGIEINRLKWAGADAATPVGTVDYSFVAGFGACAPPTDIHITSTIVPSAANGAHTDIIIDWTNSPDRLVLRNHVKYRRNGGEWLEAIATKDNTATLSNVPNGNYDIEVIAEKYGGTFSAPLTGSISLGNASPIQFAKVTGLALVGGSSSTVFKGRDAHFTWNMNSANFTDALAAGTVPTSYGYLDPTYLYYIVNVYNPSTNALIYTEHTAKNSFAFTFEKNAHATGGPLRQFRVEVGLEDRYGQQSPVFTTLTVSNPAPPQLTNVSVIGGFQNIFVQYDLPTETDWAGVKVWMGTASGFTPGPTNLAADTRDDITVLQAQTGHTYYIRLAAYDTFDQVGLNVSSELTVTAQAIKAVDIDTGAIDATKFAAGITAPTIVTTLPTTGNFEGRLVVLSSDGQLYRYHSGAWTTAIPVGSVDLTSFASGLLPVRVVSTLPTTPTPANGQTAFLTSDGKLHRYDSSIPGWTTSVDGGDIVANSITAGAIRAGAIGVNQLAADAVTATKLAVGDTTNLITDSLYQDPAYWTFIDPLGNVISYDTTTNSSSFVLVPKTLRFNLANIPASNSNVFLIATSSIPIGSNVPYLFRADAFTGSGNKSLYARTDFFDATGTAIGSAVFSPAQAPSGYNPVNEFTYPFVSPVGAASVIVYFRVVGNLPSTVAGTGSWYLGNPRLQRQTTSTVIADGAITTSKIMAGAITAATIAVGAIGADQIAANAISASKLYIGDTTNNVLDPYFADQTYWTITGTAASYSTNSTAHTLGGATAVFADCTASPAGDNAAHGVQSKLITAVEPGVSYRARCLGKASSTSCNKSAYVRITWLDSTGSVISFNQVSQTATSAYVAAGGASIECVATAPAGTNSAQVWVFMYGGGTGSPTGVGSWYLAAVRLERVMTGTAIADGAISTNKIAANAVTAAQILAGTITANEIAAGTIVAANIASQTITGDLIQAGTLNALHIQADTLTGDLFSSTFFNGFSFMASTSMPASGTLSFAANPSPGDTITLNGTVFTFRTTPVATTDIKIGTSLTNSIINAVNNLNTNKDPLACVPVTFSRSGSGPVVLTITYNAGGSAGNAYTINASAATRSAAHLTGGSDTSGYLQMDGRAATGSGGHVNGPAFRVVDDSGTTRIILGRYQDAFGIWIWDASGTNIFAEASLGNLVVQNGMLASNAVTTVKIADNSVTMPFSFTLASDVNFGATYTTVWSQTMTTNSAAEVMFNSALQGFFNSGSFTDELDYRLIRNTTIVGAYTGPTVVDIPSSGVWTIVLQGRSTGNVYTLQAGSSATMLACQK